ncbi:MAG: acyl-CoA reductase [Sphingobacteriales bacterium]|nr:MAG: acyl-CoA reductase [Sphingobacteriales bacterium]
MNLQVRLNLLSRLRNHLSSDHEAWLEAKEKAAYQNSWFLPPFIDLQVSQVCRYMLDATVLQEVVNKYGLPDLQAAPKSIGLVMAGNIPLVGFHDMLCIFLSGHSQVIKPSSKDEVLIRFIVDFMIKEEPTVATMIRFSEQLKGCDAYIATGSNHSARYFEQYFGKYPHIIRKNRTSIAILDGKETKEELDLLADDIQLYFGLGCRNVTQVWVPENYDFQPLLEALKKYDYLMDQHKYKHNYDYVLTINMMNREAYMTNGSIVLSPNKSAFSGISNLNYANYKDLEELISTLDPDTLQVITGHGFTPFGKAQCPSFFDYADGVDTLQFLVKL